MKNLFLLAAMLLGMTATVNSQSVPSYVPANGLVGWWPFNGNANDESGNGNDGLVNGASLTNDRFGNSDNAYDFDGVSSRIEIPPSNTLDNFNNAISISAWIFSEGRSGSPSYGNQDLQGIFGPATYLVNDGGFLFRLSDGSYDTINQRVINFDNAQPRVALSSASIVSTFAWEHIVCTYDGNAIKIYRNGVLSDSSAVGGGLTSSSNTAGRFYTIGQCIDWQTPSIIQAFNGVLDDIGIWNRVLNDQEISQLYNQNICYQTITVTDTLLINVNLTNLNPVTYQNTIKVFPNPTNDHITIDFGPNYSSLSGYSIRIDNAMSQVMFTSQVQQQSAYIDLNTWTGVGVYFIYLLDGQGHVIDVRKIVLQ